MTMGLLRSLVTAPVAAPQRGLTWVLQQVLAAAEGQLFDEQSLLVQLSTLNARLESGEIDEQQYFEAEAVLLERLAEARRHRREDVQ
jgi:hypothetical protein